MPGMDGIETPVSELQTQLMTVMTTLSQLGVRKATPVSGETQNLTRVLVLLDFSPDFSLSGIGYPKAWKDQEKWKGGWVRKKNGKIQSKVGSTFGVLTMSLPILTNLRSTTMPLHL